MNNLNNVVVAVDHKYSENNGAYTVVTFWDGLTKKLSTIGGPYDLIAHDLYSVDATQDQIAEAAEHYATKIYSKGWIDGSGALTFIGATVKLKRSRKAPNGVALLVVDFRKGGYNGFYNQQDPDLIVVDVDGVRVSVSESCVSEIVKGAYPWWA